MHRHAPVAGPRAAIQKTRPPAIPARKGGIVRSDIRVPEAKRGRVPCRNEDDNHLSKWNQAEPRIPCGNPKEAVSLVSRLLPGLTPADLHIQRNAQGGGTAHLLDEHTFGGFTLTGGNLENDFVVHLQQHAGLQTLLA